MGGQGVVGVLGFGKRFAVDQTGLNIGAGDFHGGGHQAFDRIGHIVALVDHIGEAQVFGLGIDQFVEHQEQAERVDGACVKVVVAVLAVVEVEACQFAGMDQAGHDLLDVGVGGVMAEVDQTFRLRPKALGGNQAGTPVGDHGGIERRFIHLVFDVKRPVRRQALVDRGHRVEIFFEHAPDVLLTGEVGAVADPDSQGGGAQLFADLDAFEVMLDGLLAGRRACMGKGAEFVTLGLADLVLKGVGVHRIKAEPVLRGLLA